MVKPQPARADTASHRRGEDAFEAGLHADAELGSIDLGLAVSPSAMALALDAPVFGQLRLGLATSPGGATQLTSLTRCTTSGREFQVEFADQVALLQLRAQVDQLTERSHVDRSALEEQVRSTAHERNESEARRVELELRLALLQENYSALERRSNEFEAASAAATRALETEQQARHAALGEREDARAELDRLRNELDAGSTTLLREVSEARAARASAEAERTKLSAEVGELADSFAAQARELEAARTEKAQINTELAEVRVAELRAHSALEVALEEAQRTSQRVEVLQGELERLGAGFDGERAALREEQAKDVEALVAGHEERLAAAISQAADSDAALAAEQEASRGLRERHETELAALRLQLGLAAADTETAQAQLRESHSAGSAWQAQLEAERRETENAREVARQRQLIVERLTAERDEARNVARALHRRMGSVAERPAASGDLAALRASLAAAVAVRDEAVAERDDYRSRLMALTGTSENEDPAAGDSREGPLAVASDTTALTTEPGIPALISAPTQPALRAQPRKKKS